MGVNVDIIRITNLTTSNVKFQDITGEATRLGIYDRITAKRVASLGPLATIEVFASDRVLNSALQGQLKKLEDAAVVSIVHINSDSTPTRVLLEPGTTDPLVTELSPGVYSIDTVVSFAPDVNIFEPTNTAYETLTFSAGNLGSGEVLVIVRPGLAPVFFTEGVDYTPGGATAADSALALAAAINASPLAPFLFAAAGAANVDVKNRRSVNDTDPGYALGAVTFDATAAATLGGAITTNATLFLPSGITGDGLDQVIPEAFSFNEDANGDVVSAIINTASAGTFWGLIYN